MKKINLLQNFRNQFSLKKIFFSFSLIFIFALSFVPVLAGDYGHKKNQAPVITILGANPFSLTVGNSFTDPGATASDEEDGNITSSIIATSTVNTGIVGNYKVTYNVKDSKGLSATPKVRTVNVNPVATSTATSTPPTPTPTPNPTPTPTPPPPMGKITFCLMLSNNFGNIATTSTGFSPGSFSLNLASTTAFGSTTIQTISWNTSTFSPNKKIILSANNDADCVTFGSLAFSNHYYSQLSVTGSSWDTPKYNDQFNTTISSTTDFFLYSPELFNSTTTDDNSRNLNADGHILLSSTENDRTLVIFERNTATSTATSTPPTPTPTPTPSPSPTPTPTPPGTTTPSGADIGVTKTADATTVNPGDVVTFTLTVVNNGPDLATSTKVSDILGSNLNFISATGTSGTYDENTGIWNIGNLANGSSTALAIIAEIATTTPLGTKITNTAIASSTASDPQGNNNSSSVEVTVNNSENNGGGGGTSTPAPTPTPSGGGGGGGGGGNGPIVGSFGNSGGGGGGNGPIVQNPVPQVPSVLGESTGGECVYLKDFLRKDFNNNPAEVIKLQIFLKVFEGNSSLSVTGVYDDPTISAVDAFQIKYKDDVLIPWGYDGRSGTDYTYITTRKKVNEIVCSKPFPLTESQQQEIALHRSIWLNIRNTATSGGSPIGTVPTPSTSSSNTDQTTLAGISSTTQNIIKNFTSGTITRVKKLGNLLYSSFAWPVGPMFGNVFSGAESLGGYNFSRMLNILLVLIIVAVSYLWYRSYKNNKRLEDINKEIDLN